jgi:hypothetical protein
MKKIINGKMYNTETATEIGENWNGYSPNDFKFIEEKLYLKQTGEFFIAGKGGPKTRYAVDCGGSTSGSSKIFPISIQDAMSWVETHCEVETYEKIFGEVHE